MAHGISTPLIATLSAGLDGNLDRVRFGRGQIKKRKSGCWDGPENLEYGSVGHRVFIKSKKLRSTIVSTIALTSHYESECLKCLIDSTF